MTEKELRRLKRSDFLQLLLAQGKEMAAVQKDLEKCSADLVQSQAEIERLNNKLDEKDELIRLLNERLDQKDEEIANLNQAMEEERSNRQIELKKAGSIAMASLSLNGVFQAAQKSADQYLENIRRMHSELEKKYRKEMGTRTKESPKKEGLKEENPAQAKPRETKLFAGLRRRFPR